MATIYSHRYFFADFLWLAVGTKLKKKNVQSFHRYIMLREKNACIFDFCMSKHFVRCNNVRETGTRFISNITKILCLFIVVNYNNDKVLSFFSRCSHSRCGSQRFDRGLLNFFRFEDKIFPTAMKGSYVGPFFIDLVLIFRATYVVASRI